MKSQQLVKPAKPAALDVTSLHALKPSTYKDAKPSTASAILTRLHDTPAKKEDNSVGYISFPHSPPLIQVMQRSEKQSIHNNILILNLEFLFECTNKKIPKDVRERFFRHLHHFDQMYLVSSNNFKDQKSENDFLHTCAVIFEAYDLVLPIRKVMVPESSQQTLAQRLSDFPVIRRKGIDKVTDVSSYYYLGHELSTDDKNILAKSNIFQISTTAFLKLSAIDYHQFFAAYSPVYRLNMIFCGFLAQLDTLAEQYSEVPVTITRSALIKAYDLSLLSETNAADFQKAINDLEENLRTLSQLTISAAPSTVLSNKKG